LPQVAGIFYCVIILKEVKIEPIKTNLTKLQVRATKYFSYTKDLPTAQQLFVFFLPHLLGMEDYYW